MEGKTEEVRQKRDQMARDALRKEVELEVEKKSFDEQARWLMATNYVYKKAEYRTDLVDGLPSEPEVPQVFQACAQFVSVEQHASPLGTAERHASTAALSALRSSGAKLADANPR